MTKFADMPKGSLNGWIAWARSHDWADGPHTDPWYDDMTGELVTYHQETDGFTWTIVEARHKTPADMKAWAGY